jgi:hypothetical protein
MLSRNMHVVIAPDLRRCRMWVQIHHQTVLRAVLPPKRMPQVACSLLQRLIQQQHPSQMSVVLSVGDRDNGCALMLFEALGALAQSLPCQIGVAANSPGYPRWKDLTDLSVVWATTRSLP